MKYIVRYIMVFLVAIITLFIYYPLALIIGSLWEFEFEWEAGIFCEFYKTENSVHWNLLFSDNMPDKKYKSFFHYLYAVLVDQPESMKQYIRRLIREKEEAQELLRIEESMR